MEKRRQFYRFSYFDHSLKVYFDHFFLKKKKKKQQKTTMQKGKYSNSMQLPYVLDKIGL
jgi:hypothetical protein